MDMGCIEGAGKNHQIFRAWRTEHPHPKNASRFEFASRQVGVRFGGMLRIKKYFDADGELRWAVGKARDIYRDNQIMSLMSCRLVYFRAPENDGFWYSAILPAHDVSFQLGKKWQNEDLENPLTTPYKQRSFALVETMGASADVVMAQEIAGDRMLEVALLEGLPTFTESNDKDYKRLVVAAIADQRQRLFPNEG